MADFRLTRSFLAACQVSRKQGLMLALVVALQLAGYRRGLLGSVFAALGAALAAVVAFGVAAFAPTE